jgi:hypothetical protein
MLTSIVVEPVTEDGHGNGENRSHQIDAAGDRRHHSLAKQPVYGNSPDEQYDGDTQAVGEP